jgi:hypothetical protein
VEPSAGGNPARLARIPPTDPEDRVAAAGTPASRATEDMDMLEFIGQLFVFALFAVMAAIVFFGFSMAEGHSPRIARRDGDRDGERRRDADRDDRDRAADRRRDEGGSPSVV